MKKEVAQVIDQERAYQEQKHPGSAHTVGEYLLIMEKCLLKGKDRWNEESDELALDEIRQVSAVGVACMEEHVGSIRGRDLKNRNSDELYESDCIETIADLNDVLGRYAFFSYPIKLVNAEGDALILREMKDNFGNVVGLMFV